VAAYFAALVPALLMAVTQPVWSLVDEAHHADYIVQLSHGVYPVANMTLIDPETLRVMESTGVFSEFALPGTYPAPDLTDVGTPPTGMSDRANAAWMRRHLWQLSSESIQPPLYYLSMVPVWWVADGLGGPFAAIYAIRIISALAIATLAPMAVAVARILMPLRPEVAVLSAIFAALLPGLDLNGTRVSNDAFAIAVGGLVVLLAVRWVGSPWTWRQAFFMGLILGAGMLIKVTLVALAPVVLVSAMWPARTASWPARVVAVLIAGGIAGGCLVPWFLLSIHDYGVLTPGPSLRLSDTLPGPLTAPWISLNLAVFELTYWSGEPWGALPLAAPFAAFGGLLALMAPVGVAKVLKDPRSSVSGPACVAVIAVLGMVAVALLLPVLAYFEFVAPGRYAYPALPALAPLIAIGVCAVLTRAIARRVAVAAYMVVALGILIASAAGLPHPPTPGTGIPPANATVERVAATGNFGGVAISVDRVAFDPAAGATWFEVTATNSGPDEAEWTVPPVATDRDISAVGDYFRSTRLPGDLDPGQSVTGWLFVPLDPDELHGGDPLRLRFLNVAVDNYRSVGDVDLDLTVSGLPRKT
jgi:4-amino-4-deoxy-L-arabinose transferase-like glycosyltransferase